MRLLAMILLSGCAFINVEPNANPTGIEVQVCVLASCADEGTSSPTRTPTNTITLPDRLETPNGS